MNSVDQIIEAYKRGLEDGRRGSDNQRPAVPYDEWQRPQGIISPRDFAVNRPPVDTPKVTCELERQTPSCSWDVR